MKWVLCLHNSCCRGPKGIVQHREESSWFPRHGSGPVFDPRPAPYQILLGFFFCVVAQTWGSKTTSYMMAVILVTSNPGPRERETDLIHESSTTYLSCTCDVALKKEPYFLFYSDVQVEKNHSCLLKAEGNGRHWRSRCGDIKCQPQSAHKQRACSSPKEQWATEQQEDDHMVQKPADNQALTLYYTHSYSVVLYPHCLTTELCNATSVELGQWEGKPTKPPVWECLLRTPLFSRSENITNRAEQIWLPWL